jgi:Fe-S oxidoreductase
MYEVMDLCVECKACKAECPSSVDMTKIKMAFLDQYWAKNGIPLRTRLFGNIAMLSRRSSGFIAPFINRVMRSNLARKGMETLLDISSERTLPAFAAQPFTKWFQENHKTADSVSAANRPKVVLFNDTFNTYYYPHTAIAATAVLEAAGFEVVLPGHKCCGRPMLSKGLVAAATQAAKDTIDRLTPFAEQGIPIVGLEPSCLLSIRDEYGYLLPEDRRIQLVADSSYTFEEFFAQLDAEGELHIDFETTARYLLLHGHCHQKSLTGTEPSKTILSFPENYSVSEVDSGCCGMAGAFGYEAEHYDISMAMAERRLLPAVRTAAEDTIIVAAGASCREQIKHGTGRTALHPAEVLYRAMITAESN